MMKTNIQKAVLLITALSFLLGLSLGQAHRQQKRIDQLESNVVFDYHKKKKKKRRPRCEVPCSHSCAQELENLINLTVINRQLMRQQLRKEKERLERLKELQLEKVFDEAGFLREIRQELPDGTIVIISEE